MTDITQPIRDALAAFETADSYRDDKEAVCDFHDALTRSKVIALLAHLDAAEKDAAAYRFIVKHACDQKSEVIQDAFVAATINNYPTEQQFRDVITEAMKGKP